jgi:hypothetical protein
MSDGSEYSQLPEDIEKLQRNYYPSDDLIIPNDAETSTTSTTYVLMKEITLKLPVFPTSKFRFKFKLHGGSTPSNGYAKIYRNGIPIGTEQIVLGYTYVEKIEDIAIPDLMVDDKIQLFAHAEGTIHYVFVQDFRLCGIASEFVNTKEEY